MTTINTSPQYLVITAIGENKTGLVSELTGLVYQSGCNVVDSKMAIFANEFSIIMLLEGEQLNLVQLETQLPQLAMNLGLLTMMKRTQKRHLPDDINSHYLINIEGPDKAGTIKDVTSLLAKLQIDITSLKSATDSKSGIVFQSAQIEVLLSESQTPEALENELITLCNGFNMSCTVSPITIEL